MSCSVHTGRVEPGIGEPERAPHPLREVVVDAGARPRRRGASAEGRRARPARRRPRAGGVRRSRRGSRRRSRRTPRAKSHEGELFLEIWCITIEDAERDEIVVALDRAVVRRFVHRLILLRAAPHPTRRRSTTRHRGPARSPACPEEPPTGARRGHRATAPRTTPARGCVGTLRTSTGCPRHSEGHAGEQARRRHPTPRPTMRAHPASSGAPPTGTNRITSSQSGAGGVRLPNRRRARPGRRGHAARTSSSNPQSSSAATTMGSGIHAWPPSSTSARAASTACWSTGSGTVTRIPRSSCAPQPRDRGIGARQRAEVEIEVLVLQPARCEPERGAERRAVRDRVEERRGQPCAAIGDRRERALARKRRS